MREVTRRDAPLKERYLAAPFILTVERMRSLHQQAEDQDGQPEMIVLHGTVYGREIVALQLGRSELGLADHAAIDRAGSRVPNLKRIGIDQRHPRLYVEQDIGLVDIADKIAALVHGRNGGGEVRGGLVQVAVVESGTPFATFGRVVTREKLNRV